MPVTAKCVKEYLMSVAEYQCVAASCMNRIEDLQTSITKITSQLTGMPHGGGSDSAEKLTRYISDMDEAKKDWEKWSNATHHRRHRVEYFIKDMPLEDSQKSVLIKRYCLNYSWVELKCSTGFSESKLFGMHREALETCANYINETGNYYDEVKEYLL